MSEELAGRARGRARGRTRLQQSTAGPSGDQRRPGGAPFHPPSISQPPEPETSRSVAEPRIGRVARGAALRPVEPVGSISQKMGTLTVSGQSETASTSGPTRGGVRSRRIDELQIPTKPEGVSIKQGTSGISVQLKSNYFKLQTVTEWALYQYRVDFAPDDERTAVRKGLLRIHSETLGPYIFDGTVLYAIKKLHPDPLELYSSRLSDDVKIRITIKKTTDLVLGDPHYLQFFNIVIRKCIAGLNLQLVGRDYFDAAMKVKVDKYNLEIWPGFVTSVRQHENDLLLGVDLANKIMRKDRVLDLIMEISHRSSNGWENAFLHAILGATVLTPYNNKTYRVDDVDFSLNPECTFEKGKERISYIDYYYQRYQLKITNRTQPLLVSRPKVKDIHGGRSNNVILIPELCCMTGITDEMRNNFQLMRELQEHTRLLPKARMEKVTTFMKRLTTNTLAQTELSLWNLKFAPDLVEFTGRILAPERILHGNNESCDGNQEADWTKFLRGHAMYHAKDFHSWSIVYLRKSQRDVESFCRTLANASASLQFKIPQPVYVDLPDDRSSSYVQAIERIMAQSNPQLIMCIVPNNRADRYDAIKKKCYVDRCVPSQVVLSKNLTNKGIMSIATKIGIQVNCKIGGSPWSVVVPFKKPVMVVGFDVCHDTNSRERSYGAMVASLDGAYSKYFSAATPHTSGEELCSNFGAQLVKAVLTYRNLNGFLPPKIVIYRDGVGEGNEHYCLRVEVENIRVSLQDLYKQEKLQMAFVLVSKRINTRLFYKNGNPPPGTIADDVITNPIKYDFFLISQSIKQGTVAPTSYNVIYDTTQLAPDMQKLTYKMTHLY